MNVALRAGHLDILSLCTGGAGLDLGVELAFPGARTVCMVEREAFAVSHLVSAMEQGLLYPAPVWSDARTFDGRAWRGCVDGLIGGIPCQPHSLAGKRLGEDDERDLWSTARRIVVQSGAWFVLIENVGGMLSSGGAERVWRDLRRLGFAVEGGLFTAAEVGASHERERLFLLAVADSGRDGQLRRSERAGMALRPDQQTSWRHDAHGCGLDVGDASSVGWREGRPEPILQEWDGASASFASAPVGDDDGGGQHRDTAERPSATPLFPPGPRELDAWRAVLDRAPELEPAVRRMADGVAARVDRLRMLGNGVVSLEAAYAVRTLGMRLAGRGSAGAARLVRMMGAA